MRLEVLEEFRELGHCLNLTEAARRLGIAQPNLSKHISELEKELGFNLFARGRKVHLTLAGKAYLSAVCNMLYEHEKSLAECQEIIRRGGREIRLMEPFVNNEASELLQKAACSFVNCHPQDGIVFINARTRTAVEAVLENVVDIALTIGGGENEGMQNQARSRGLSFEPILTVPLLVWLHKDHPLAKQSAITPDDLSASSTMMSIANRANDPFRFVTRGLFNSKPSWSVIGVRNPKEFFLHANERDATFITPAMAKDFDLMIHDGMVVRPVADKRAKVVFYLVYDECADDESIREMIRLIRDMAQTIGGAADGET